VLEKLEEILQRTKTTNYTAAKIEIIQQLEEHFKVEISEHYSFVSKIIQIWQNKTPTSRDDIRVTIPFLILTPSKNTTVGTNERQTFGTD
jgi:hypothetical protein